MILYMDHQLGMRLNVNIRASASCIIRDKIYQKQKLHKQHPY